MKEADQLKIIKTLKMLRECRFLLVDINKRSKKPLFECIDALVETYNKLANYQMEIPIEKNERKQNFINSKGPKALKTIIDKLKSCS